MDVEISAVLPPICTASDNFTTTLSMSQPSKQEKSHIVVWSVRQDITVPPLKSVKVTLSISTAQYTMPYTAKIQFQGYGNVWCKNQVRGNLCWYLKASSWLTGGGCYSSDGSDSVCPFSGMFSGVQSIKAVVTIGPA